ncbi:interleukin 1 receptor antagonist, partial [Chelydra serpentina]
EKICWVPNRSFEREKFPIILGIQDGRRSLACGTGALPALQLEVSGEPLSDLCVLLPPSLCQWGSIPWPRAGCSAGWRWVLPAHPAPLESRSLPAPLVTSLPVRAPPHSVQTSPGPWLAPAGESPSLTSLSPSAQDVNITELSRGGEETTRFTFFRSYKDGMWRFESAANPGWLLCTSAQSNEPLGLTTSPDSAHIVDFYFQLC